MFGYQGLRFLVLGVVFLTRFDYGRKVGIPFLGTSLIGPIGQIRPIGLEPIAKLHLALVVLAGSSCFL